MLFKTFSWEGNEIFVYKKNSEKNEISERLEHIKKDEQGKPYLDKGYISISHTDKYDVYAFSTEGYVGVDIEPCDRPVNKEIMITDIKEWTIKEAVIKTFKLISIKCVLKVNIASGSIAVYNGKKYNYKVFDFDNHYLAVAKID
ncbi:MAG: hypothetical protein LBM76_01085 [Mycoplasmataceae bacterium]|jgi:phosphopantetheinyl transferase (holo-ACP synthase)|nr:hypothetical protein [Mycoplasmataceae bacterium]